MDDSRGAQIQQARYPRSLNSFTVLPYGIGPQLAPNNAGTQIVPNNVGHNFEFASPSTGVHNSDVVPLGFWRVCASLAWRPLHE